MQPKTVSSESVIKPGLPSAEIHGVSEAIIMPVLYVTPASSKNASAHDIESLQKVIINAKRWRIVEKDYVFEDLFHGCNMCFSAQRRAQTIASTNYSPVKSQRCHKMSLQLRRAARILEEGGPILGPSIKKGPRGVTPGNILKNLHAIWCIMLHVLH